MHKFLNRGLLFPFMILAAVTLQGTSEDIHDAAQKGNLDVLKTLVEKNPDLLNLPDSQSMTPLHWAVRGLHLDCIRFLAENGADINAQDQNRVSPLHSLAARNHTEGIRILLDNGADINILDQRNQTPLHSAATTGRAKAVTLLAEKGAGLEIKDNYGRTPLLVCAREQGGPEVTRILIQAGANVNARDRSGATPLNLASWRGYKEVVDILLDNGAEIPSEGNAMRRLLINSTDRGLDRLFEILAGKGADLEYQFRDGSSLLHSAAKGGSVKIIESLIAKKLDINRRDRYGWTPLHYAVQNRMKDAVKTLLGLKADTNIRSISGYTPFNLAQENKQTEIIDIMTGKEAVSGPMEFPHLSGGYLGQSPPADNPEIFALGIVTSIWGLHSSITFSPDGKEAYWVPMVVIPGQPYSSGIIYGVKQENNRWTAPFIAGFSDLRFDDDVPFFSPDGKRLFFISGRPIPGNSGSRGERIWYVDKTDDQWGSPQPLELPDNFLSLHWQFSVDKMGNLYVGAESGEGFGRGDIYCIPFKEGRYQAPKNLGRLINSDKGEDCPFIAPDGSYLIFCRQLDLWISYRNQNEDWGEPIKMDSPINSPAYELCPLVSPDGKYLFFISSRGGENGIYWVDAGIIQKMKPAAVQ